MDKLILQELKQANSLLKILILLIIALIVTTSMPILSWPVAVVVFIAAVIAMVAHAMSASGKAIYRHAKK